MTSDWRPFETAPTDGKPFLAREARRLCGFDYAILTGHHLSNMFIDYDCNPWDNFQWLPIPGVEYEQKEDHP